MPERPYCLLTLKECRKVSFFPIWKCKCKPCPHELHCTIRYKISGCLTAYKDTNGISVASRLVLPFQDETFWAL